MDNKTIRHFGKNTLNEFVEEVKERIISKIEKIEKTIPTKVSQLENDKVFVTEEYVNNNSGKVKTVNGTEPDENGNIETKPVFTFTISLNEDGKYQADKSFDEITEAYNNGFVIMPRLKYKAFEEFDFTTDLEMLLTGIDSTLVCFVSTRGGNLVTLDIMRNNQCAVNEFNTINRAMEAKEGQVLAVKYTDENKANVYEYVDLPQVFSGSWNDLEDKPFYDYEDYVSINELLNDIIFIDNNRIEITGVPKLSIQEGKIYNVRLQNEHSILDYKEVCKYYVNASLGLFGNYLGGTIIDDVEETQNGFIIFQESNNTMYVLVDTNRISLPCTVSVYIGETKSVPLDEKYIPTNIPKIQSATVGQTIVVKEVDENGKPTEWECVDASGGDCQMCKMSDFGVYVEEQVGPGEYNRQLTFECTKLPKYGIIFNDLYSSSNTLWKITKNGEELSNLDEDDFYGGADYIFVCTLYGSTSLKMGNSILSIDLINNLYRAQTKES